MKAEINERGTLSIVAETPLECYALERWVNQTYGCKKIEGNIDFDWSYPKIEASYLFVEKGKEYGYGPDDIINEKE
jgi:hypothetical protein